MDDVINEILAEVEFLLGALVGATQALEQIAESASMSEPMIKEYAETMGKIARDKLNQHRALWDSIIDELEERDDSTE